MGAIEAWAILIVAVLALALPTAWFLVPVARAARTWVLDPSDGDALQRLGISGMRRGLAACPFVVGGSLLVHYLYREPFTKTELVNYEILAFAAAGVAIVYLIAVRQERSPH